MEHNIMAMYRKHEGGEWQWEEQQIQTDNKKWIMVLQKTQLFWEAE